MSKTDSEPNSFVELNCGCIIDDLSGYLRKECTPHKEGNFIH